MVVLGRWAVSYERGTPEKLEGLCVARRQVFNIVRSTRLFNPLICTTGGQIQASASTNQVSEINELVLL